MLATLLTVSALAAGALAAPVYPELNVDAAMPGGIDTMSQYFNMLADKVQQSRLMSQAPVCDLSRAVLPTVPSGLPSPSAGLTLKHVAIGRGVQNYTCDTKNATAVPVAVGAVATLFNASCVASTYPDLLALLPKVALEFNLTSDESPRMGATNLIMSGAHFFTNATTPFFNLDTQSMKLGEIPCAKNNTASAPADSPKGQQGEGAVAWLKLVSRQGATGDLQEVFRVETAGGSPPALCTGMPAAFSVQYSAQYWFYQGKKSQ
ncbi:hypothetical protein GQ53DRAFT_748689 [Thozetella sp. PMI_491]|nr:hypothetical protein GQ53DRAFT_748689 [Thozetella sp. PMI_491]